jgi:phage terminase large subunit-like protein
VGWAHVKDMQFSRINVGVDPSGGVTETGIIIAGVGSDAHAYVLGDYTAGGQANVWAQAVVKAYHDFKADWVIAEANNGGDMVRHTIHTADPNVPVKVVHASRGKRIRAEPVSAVYEQRRVHHAGSFPQLEDELCQWVPDEMGPGEQSPNRLDALVWAIGELTGVMSNVDAKKAYGVVECTCRTEKCGCDFAFYLPENDPHRLCPRCGHRYEPKEVAA